MRVGSLLTRVLRGAVFRTRLSSFCGRDPSNRLAWTEGEADSSESSKTTSYAR